VLRYESVIHEFDPYFNYRSTIKLVQEGVYEFWNWFDSDSWYPLGRVIGGTVYPGIMFTAAAMYKILEKMSITVLLRDVCVFTGPFFAGNTVSSAAAGRAGPAAAGQQQQGSSRAAAQPGAGQRGAARPRPGIAQGRSSRRDVPHAAPNLCCVSTGAWAGRPSRRLRPSPHRRRPRPLHTGRGGVPVRQGAAGHAHRPGGVHPDGHRAGLHLALGRRLV
jgi:hypothetical protein